MAFDLLKEKKQDGPWLEATLFSFQIDPVEKQPVDVLYYALKKKVKGNPTMDEWWLVSMDGRVVRKADGPPPRASFNGSSLDLGPQYDGESETSADTDATT